MSAAFGWAGRVAGRDPAPLRVRAAGFTYPPQQRGHQTAWVRFCTGIWSAIVDIDLSTADGRHTEPVTLWLPAAAITVVDGAENSEAPNSGAAST